MKRRYYLRGLGIGIVVTALIMGMGTRNDSPLTDADIRARAYALGMVDADSRSLSDIASSAPSGGQELTQGGVSPAPAESEEPETTESPVPSSTPEVSESPEPTESPGPSESPVPSESPIPSETPEVTESPESAVTQQPAADSYTGETVTISIVRGDSSYTVSRRLEEAGLIDDARGFDSYLVDNGYSRTIRTGTYQIPVGASWEEIAAIIA